MPRIPLRDRIETLVAARPGVTPDELRAVLPDASRGALTTALWRMTGDGTLTRRGEGYVVADDEWTPTAWVHPYRARVLQGVR